MGSTRGQPLGVNTSMHGLSQVTGQFGAEAVPDSLRRVPETQTPNLGINRGLSGIGLTSGLKVSQAQHHSGLDAVTRAH